MFMRCVCVCESEAERGRKWVSIHALYGAAVKASEIIVKSCEKFTILK